MKIAIKEIEAIKNAVGSDDIIFEMVGKFVKLRVTWGELSYGAMYLTTSVEQGYINMGDDFIRSALRAKRSAEEVEGGKLDSVSEDTQTNTA